MPPRAWPVGRWRGLKFLADLMQTAGGAWDSAPRGPNSRMCPISVMRPRNSLASRPARHQTGAGQDAKCGRGDGGVSLTKLVHRPDQPAGVSPARTRRVSHRATAGGRAAEAEQRQGRAYALCFVSQSTKRKSDPAGCHPAGCPARHLKGAGQDAKCGEGWRAFSLTKLVHRPDEPAGVSPARGRSPRHGRWKSSRGRVQLTLCALSHKAQSVSLTLLAGRTPRFRLPPRFGAFGLRGQRRCSFR